MLKWGQQSTSPPLKKSLGLPTKNPYLNPATSNQKNTCPIFLPKKIPESKISTEPKISFDHPRHLKSEVPDHPRPPPLPWEQRSFALYSLFSVLKTDATVEQVMTKEFVKMRMRKYFIFSFWKSPFHPRMALINLLATVNNISSKFRTFPCFFNTCTTIGRFIFLFSSSCWYTHWYTHRFFPKIVKSKFIFP